MNFEKAVEKVTLFFFFFALFQCCHRIGEGSRNFDSVEVCFDKILAFKKATQSTLTYL